jgi:hypothetical protein
VYVESLIKSFLFPGFESVGKIIYPNPQSYSFDLYALTAENIAAARVDLPDAQAKEQRSRDVTPPDDDDVTPEPNDDNPLDGIGLGRGGLRPANRMSRLSLERWNWVLKLPKKNPQAFSRMLLLLAWPSVRFQKKSGASLIN